MLHHISLGVVWVTDQLSCSLAAHIFDARKGSDMNFNPVNLSVLILPSESMGSVFMQISITIRSSSVAKVDDILMAAFPGMRDEVPEIVGILEACARIFLS